MDTAIETKKTTSVSGSFRLNRIILLAAAALLLRAFFIYETPLVPLKVGDSIPEFKLELFNGNSISKKDVMGSPHVLFFYAGWCPCSHFSTPFVNRAFEEYSGKGLKFLGIGFQDTKDHLKSFALQHKLPFAAGPDIQDRVSKSFGIGTPPTIVFLNSKGKIKSIFTGKIKKYRELTTHLEKLL